MSKTFYIEKFYNRRKTKRRLLPRDELLGPIAVERQKEVRSEIDDRLRSRWMTH